MLLQHFIQKVVFRHNPFDMSSSNNFQQQLNFSFSIEKKMAWKKDFYLKCYLCNSSLAWPLLQQIVEIIASKWLHDSGFRLLLEKGKHD